jgi:nucleotide-binding universal stress UspA family protein
MAQAPFPDWRPAEPAPGPWGHGPGRLRHVVAGVDGSTASFGAARRAAELAVMAGARLTVVHVRPRAPAFSALAALTEAAVQQWREDLEWEVVVELTVLLDPLGICWRLQVEEGDPARRLDEVTRALGADLLVVGTSRRRRPRLRRSVAYRVVRNAHTPVLVVHA